MRLQVQKSTLTHPVSLLIRGPKTATEIVSIVMPATSPIPSGPEVSDEDYFARKRPGRHPSERSPGPRGDFSDRMSGDSLTQEIETERRCLLVKSMLGTLWVALSAVRSFVPESIPSG